MFVGVCTQGAERQRKPQGARATTCARHVLQLGEGVVVDYQKRLRHQVQVRVLSIIADCIILVIYRHVKTRLLILLSFLSFIFPFSFELFFTIIETYRTFVFL